MIHRSNPGILPDRWKIQRAIRKILVLLQYRAKDILSHLVDHPGDQQRDIVKSVEYHQPHLSVYIQRLRRFRYIRQDGRKYYPNLDELERIANLTNNFNYLK